MRRASSPEAAQDLVSGWEEEQFLVETRRIHLLGEINDRTAEYVIQRLQRLGRDSGTAPVHLYISSDGGSVDSGFAIIDQMLLLPCPVKTIVTGRGLSMGAVIAAYGTRGHRYITRHATAMLHPIMFGLEGDYVEQQYRMADFVRRDYQAKMASLAKQIRMPCRRLFALIEKGLWLDAAKAIELGLADDYWTPKLEAAVNVVGKSGASAGRLAQIGRILAVMADGIRRGEDFEVEQSA